ncbi:MAG: hypothetical protein AB7S38_12095 [Vulcanimicrobiota bacterium]
MQLGPLDRPTPRALAFAAGLTPRPPVVVEGEDQALPSGPLDQVAVVHADAHLISHQSTPAIEQAARQLQPGGALMVTTGRGLMGDLDAFQERMDSLGFHTMGVIFQEKAYVVAEKDVLPGLGSVSPEQSRLLLARTQFAGQPDAHRQIEAAGLAPRFTTSFEGRRVHLSRPFRCRGYQATLGYVEGKDGSLKARLFYQSKSQGLWRSASGLLGQVLGKGPEGQFESSTTLPASLQKTLNGLTTAVPPVEGEQEVAFHAPLEKLALKGGGQFDHELTAVHFGHFASDRPDSFVYARPELAPDFSKVRDQFTLEHPSRGQLHAYVVDSQDESARYLFLRDSDQRAWLGSVEARTEVNSFMVPSQAYRLGALTHPAIEYVQQVPPEYRGETVVKEQVYNHFTKAYEELPTYVDATSFVYQLPPVRDFQSWQAARR